MVTILVSGPQASGKTTLSLALGRELDVPVFSRDPLMAVLSAAGLPRRRVGRLHAFPAVGLDLQTALLARQLELGQSAILECVAPTSARATWRRLTMAAGARFITVECICSDRAEHRARFERRQGTADRRGYGWKKVVATMDRHYRPEPRPDFLADAVNPVTVLVAGILAVVRNGADENPAEPGPVRPD
jgi:predicted kinase